MTNKAYVVVVSFVVLSATTAYSYEVETHREISKNAVEQSSLRARLPDLGLTSLDDLLPNNTGDYALHAGILSSVYCFDVFGPGRRSILDLIKLGAFCEDSTAGTAQIARYTNHFYDPVHNGQGFLGTFPSSLVWGLEANDIATQDYSYKDVRDYLYKGLTLLQNSDRDANMALAFRTLGHVIHLIQDLAQPQHTRNDPHGSGSLYEAYTETVRTSLPFGGYSPVKGTTPELFWHTADGKGMADYSNRGFVTAGTNFRGSSNNMLPNLDYPLPDGTGAVVISRQITDPDLLGPVSPTQPLSGEIRFIQTPVQDNYTGLSDTNPRTSTFSLFDDDLQVAGRSMVFSLNRFNFEEAHKLLIPRAVGYSAGLINYFFRGRMAISLPDEGVYGIVDHTTVAGSDPKTGGFDKIKLKLQNITPGGTDGNGNAVVEKMDDSAGSTATLVAVAKFHVNNCYKADLSGEYGALNPDGSLTNDWKRCRSNDEQIVVSQPVTADKFAGINDGSKQILFDFSANKIPISATDLYLQVVYRGKLGQEADAVVVTTQDISEPTYFYAAPHWDQYMYCRNGIIGFSSGSGQATCDQYTFKESFCDQLYSNLTYEQCKAREGWTIKAHAAPLPGYDPDPAVPAGEWQLIGQEVGFAPLYTLAAPIGTLARVAVLTDAAPQNQMVSVQEWGVSPNLGNVFVWGMGTPKATIVQLDAQTGKLDPSVRYAKARGVYVETVSYPYLSNHTAPLNQIPDLVMVSSQINF